MLAFLEKITAHMPLPMSEQLIQEFGRDHFLILISCLLSLRARDVVTIKVCRALFKQVRTPQDLIGLDLQKLEKILFPLGFYRKKALVLQQVSRDLIKKFKGRVPSSEEELLSLPGVGRKTAQLVRGHAFGIPAICVDIHVHRLSNRLGWVCTKTPEQTERALEKLFPRDRWIMVNHVLVVYGQNVCTSRSPLCSQCPLSVYCPRVGVTKKR